jgi:predicted RND superfamily exporter protein
MATWLPSPRSLGFHGSRASCYAPRVSDDRAPKPPHEPAHEGERGPSSGPPSQSPSPERARPARRADAFWERLGRAQVARPVRFLLAMTLLAALGGLLATRLVVQTGFEAMLPQDRPSVRELRRVGERTAGVSTLFVVLEGENRDGLRKAADALVPELLALGKPWVGSAESGVHDAVKYLGPRAGLFLEHDKLKKLRDDVTARFEWEVAKAQDQLLDESDPPPPIDAKYLEKNFGLGGGEGASAGEGGPDGGQAKPKGGANPGDPASRYPDGYYQSQDGKAVVVTVRSGVMGTDLAQATECLRKVREVVERVGPKQYDPSVRVGLTGDLVIGLSEYRAINDDLTEVGITGAVGIMLVVLGFYLRARTLVAMLLTIGVGVAATFGLTYATIGHLNMATGFLFTIVAGNGINFAIVYMARYLELRREGKPLELAIVGAHQDTWLPTLTAGCAAGAAYASLLVTEFRGFRDFGFIGGAGMVLCWACTFATLPAILVLLERWLPIATTAEAGTGLSARIRRRISQGISYGKPFAWLVRRAPGVALFLAALLTAGSIAATVRHAKREPMEYDLNNLQSDMSNRKEEQRLIGLAMGITGFIGQDGMAIMVDRVEQVEPLRAALRARRDAAPKGLEPFKEVHALQDFVPARQAEKIPLLLELKDKIVRTKKRGGISEADWKKLEPIMPPDELTPFGIADLPENLARMFTESDGTRGRIVYISPTDPGLTADARYLFRWADSFRRTELPDGSVILGSGRAVIYADMWSAVIGDIPKAVVASLIATLLVVALAFRFGRASFYVAGSLLLGVLWMVGLYSLLDIKLNFLNFIALPLTFGIGVDYAVNVMQRAIIEGPGGAARAIEHTGGAVILCSLTTVIGYLALVRSLNYGVRSMGLACVIGELTCLFAAVLVLPALLTLLDRRKASAQAA